jgi:hypothetical protein
VVVLLLVLAFVCFLVGALAELFTWTLGDLSLRVLLFGGLALWVAAGFPWRRQPP